MTSLSSRHNSLSNKFESPPPTYKPQRSPSISLSRLKPQCNLNELIQIKVNAANTKPHTSSTPNKQSCLPQSEEQHFAYDILSNQPFHRIYIFDFDDTIFPTSIIQKNIKIWNHTAESTINEYKQCNTLYTSIKSCVEYIINLQTDLTNKYGKNNISFVIITNASIDWFNEIKTDHSQLIAQLIHKLQTYIPIISAKDEFESKYDDWYSECATIAKTDAIINYIQSIQNIKQKIPVIYSIGDGKPEFEASQNACCELYENDTECDEQSMQDTDLLYILHRIQLKSNRKANNRTFKSLNRFWKVLSKTKKFLFHNDKELRDTLENMNINCDSDDSDSDDESMRNIIDYRL